MSKSIADARKHLLNKLTDAGIESSEARVEADLILRHVIGCSSTELLLGADQLLTEENVRAIQLIVEQRQRRVPLQYCIGETWFMGLRLAVNSSVLIPRPDTETLVERVCELLRGHDAPLFADIGTGSGAISIALLHLLSGAHALAIDISADALKVAQYNSQLNHVSSRMELHCADWHQFNPLQKLDAVVSNPPYIPLSEAGDLQPEVRQFEPPVALFGSDSDGLGFYRGLSATIPGWLKHGGFIAVEVGHGQAEQVMDIFSKGAWQSIAACKDLNGISRVVTAFTV